MSFPFSLLPLAGLFKIHYPDTRADIDSFFSKFNYKITTTLCLLLAFISHEFFGPAIKCDISKYFSQEYVDSFCWTSAMYNKSGIFFKGICLMECSRKMLQNLPK